MPFDEIRGVKKTPLIKHYLIINKTQKTVTTLLNCVFKPRSKTPPSRVTSY